MLKMKNTDCSSVFFKVEESCDLKVITVAEFIGKLQAHEHRAVPRAEETAEGAFQAKEKQHAAGYGRRQLPSKAEKGKAVDVQSQQLQKDKFPPCPTCKRTNHEEKDCGYKWKLW
ncbi:hypothetical protein SLEP1_g793 [Rubroshorea leprosula]|uniref:Uncharacterized protein n=1 Tax=Rubroshorea leprosula TaxID=152421 RepID=A0AAV5HM51_9ROSI|nr:hypothetical protein SLEP1_g793 [Rubroshorea leprosula]